MNANIRLRDIYPVALFVTALMMWGLVGKSNPQKNTVPTVEWNNFLQSTTVDAFSCEGRRLSFLSNNSCENNQYGELVSPLFEERKVHSRLMSRLENQGSFINQ